MNVSDIIKLSHCMIKTRKVRFTTTVIVLGTVFGIIFAGLAILNEVKNAVFEQCAIDASVSISNDDCVSAHEVMDKFDRDFTITVTVVSTLTAMLVSTFTLAHILAEDRRNFVLYRSLGATNYQIALIYLVHLFEICFFAVLFAILLALVIAIFISLLFRENIVSFVKSYFPISDLPTILFKFSYQNIIVIGMIFATAPVALFLNIDQFAVGKAVKYLKESS